jgi:hypothetical protein
MLFKVLIVSLAFVALASAIVCPPNVCDNVRCAAVEQNGCESNGGIFVPKGGFCGCCDACPHKLNVGEGCMLTLIRGSPAPVRCAVGTHCDIATKVCKAN